MYVYGRYRRTDKQVTACKYFRDADALNFVTASRPHDDDEVGNDAAASFSRRRSAVSETECFHDEYRCISHLYCLAYVSAKKNQKWHNWLSIAMRLIYWFSSELQVWQSYSFL